MGIELHKLSDPLEASDIEFKPQTVFKWGQDSIYCTIVSYKNARTDMYLLDTICGPENWQNEYKRDSKGVLQCGIDIKCKGEWIWKWSNGTETYIEKQKGEYSDALKRAGVMWGIGRCLYDMPTVHVILNESEYYFDNDQKIKLSKSFQPNNWKWVIDWGELEGVFKLTGTEILKSGKHVVRYNSNPYDSKNQRK